MRYLYCPKCGRKLIEKLAGDDGLVPYCEACDKLWFDAFGSCVIIMIVNEMEEVVTLGNAQYGTYKVFLQRK